MPAAARLVANANEIRDYNFETIDFGLGETVKTCNIIGAEKIFL